MKLDETVLDDDITLSRAFFWLEASEATSVSLTSCRQDFAFFLLLKKEERKDMSTHTRNRARNQETKEMGSLSRRLHKPRHRIINKINSGIFAFLNSRTHNYAVT